jgi:peroxiredoxin
MTIEAGQTLPDVKLVKSTESEREPVQTGEYFKGKTVALFSVPGAFTPPARPSTCPASSKRPPN